MADHRAASLARERGPSYDASAPAGRPLAPDGGEGGGMRPEGAATLAQATAQLAAAVDALGEVEVAAEPDGQVADATVALWQQIACAQARLVGLVGEVDRRQVYQHDGAVTAAA